MKRSNSLPFQYSHAKLIADNDINQNMKLFETMLDHPKAYSQTVFQAAIDSLASSETKDQALLDQLKQCLTEKKLAMQAAREARRSFCYTSEPANLHTIFHCSTAQIQPVNNKMHSPPLASIHESDHEHKEEEEESLHIEATNKTLYATHDLQTMYLVMTNMSERPYLFSVPQLRIALHDLSQLPPSPRENEPGLKGRLSVITTNRKTPFNQDMRATLHQALTDGLTQAQTNASNSRSVSPY